MTNLRGELLSHLINPTVTMNVMAEVMDERARQDKRWGQQDFPDGTGPETLPLHLIPEEIEESVYSLRAADLLECAREAYECGMQDGTVTQAHILLEELFEVLAEDDDAGLIIELTQTAAVCVKWAESVMRRNGWTELPAKARGAAQ